MEISSLRSDSVDEVQAVVGGTEVGLSVGVARRYVGRARRWAAPKRQERRPVAALSMTLRP